MMYEIITALSSHALEKQVNKKIEFGWVPQGGVSYWAHGGLSTTERWSQAMVRKT